MIPLLLFVFIGVTFFVAPYVGVVRVRRRQHRSELARCGGKVRYVPASPHFTRDPSPRPRKQAI